MAEEDKPLELRGAPEGATMDNIDPGQTSSGDGIPTAPTITNTPPPADKAGDEEEFADPATKVEAKPEDKPEDKAKVDEPKVEDDPAPEDYEEIGDPAADGVQSILKEAGVELAVANEIFREAAETGDISKIDVAKLTELVGKAKADVILIAAQDYYTRTIGTTQAVVSAVHEVVGGQKNWDSLAKWAQIKQSADPEFKKQCEEYNRMFDLSKTAATMAAKALMDAYNADNKNKSLDTVIVTGTKSGAGVDYEPLTRADYVEKLKAAHDKNDIEEINRLNQQRLATRNLK